MDEHLAGFCTEIRVVLEKDGTATVTDNGRGIPVDMHQKGISAARLVFTTLHAGGKFDDSAYKTSGGLHGVGSSVVNALSTYMDVKISVMGRYTMTDMSAEFLSLNWKTDFFLRSERQKRQEQQLIFCLMIRFLKRRSSGRRK